MKLSETSIPANYATEYAATVGPEVFPDEVICIFKGTFAAVSDFFKTAKKKNQKVALKFVDGAGNFIMAGVVEYNKNEEEGQDNWNYYFTFDEDDLKDVKPENLYDTNAPHLHAGVTNRLLEFNLRINESAYIAPMLTLVARSLQSFLDQNAKPDGEVTVEEDGYFKASVAIEDNEPAKSVLPAEEMKQLIKDDAATEKAA